jgi:hypothetical protein
MELLERLEQLDLVLQDNHNICCNIIEDIRCDNEAVKRSMGIDKNYENCNTY